MVDMVGMLSLSIIGEITLMLVMVLGMDMVLVIVCYRVIDNAVWVVCDHGEILVVTNINNSPPTQGWRSKGWEQ